MNCKTLKFPLMDLEHDVAGSGHLNLMGTVECLGLRFRFLLNDHNSPVTRQKCFSRKTEKWLMTCAICN